MKTNLIAVAAVCALAAPLAALADTTGHPTRAEVRAQLQQIESAGYQPARRDDATYPGDIQAAEARVARHDSPSDVRASGMGPSTGSQSQSGGRPASSHARAALYEHH